MGPYFCGCCPLRMAVRNICIYTLTVHTFDVVYCVTVRSELIMPSKFIYKYPSNYAKMEITLFLMILYGLLALSVIPLFFSTIYRNVALTLPYLALQMAKLLSEVVLTAVGVALAPWNTRHAQMCAMIVAIRIVTIGWDFYLFAAVFSFLQRSRYL